MHQEKKNSRIDKSVADVAPVASCSSVEPKTQTDDIHLESLDLIYTTSSFIHFLPFYGSHRERESAPLTQPLGGIGQRTLFLSTATSSAYTALASSHISFSRACCSCC